MGYETLRAANPRLIYCALTGYGQTGPQRDRAGHDLNFVALAGMLSHTGRKASGPAGMGVQVADVGGGSFGAITAILAAVIQRLLGGQGQLVDISMFDMALAWNSLAAAEFLASDANPGYETGPLNGGSVYDTCRSSPSGAGIHAARTDYRPVREQRAASVDVERKRRWIPAFAGMTGE